MCYNCKQHFLPLRPRLIPPGVSEVVALSWYEGKVRDSLQRLKYYNAPHMARQLGILSVDIWGDVIRSYEVITAVPMHRKSYILRGYNQSELVARQIGVLAERPYSNLLRRVRATRPQHDLPHYRRRQNVKDAFSPILPLSSGKRVLLVDDILTTGSTAASCAKALKASGITEVGLLAIAYTRP